MKKFRFFSFASAMLLASAAGMVSCSSDSIEPTDGSGVAGQVVKTQFYINIPYKGNNGSISTRMTDVNTQNTGDNSTNFLGMVNTQMYAFKGEPGSTGNTTSVKAISIGDAADASSKDEWRNVYRDIAIPVGTKNLLLYARANKNSKTNFEAGSLSNPYASTTTADATDLSALNFALTEVNKDKDFSTEGTDILNALNLVANTSVTEPGTTTTIKWSEIDNSNLGTTNEREALKERYKKFIALTSGSANSVKLLIGNLKNVINGSSSLESEKLMANAIVTNCTNALENLKNSAAKDFPRNLNLPDGVAKVKWNDTSNAFEYVTVTSAGSTTTTGNHIDYTTITYPSELAYYVSSPVKVSSNEITAVKDLPEYDKWIGNTADWSSYGDAVESSTRFVALQKPVLYGVASLKSTVKCVSNTLTDNAKDKGQHESDNSITVDDTSFPITGILIGGQPKQVGWNFEAANTVTTNEFKYTIYDRNMNKGTNLTAAVTGTAEPNYTLVLDNKDNSGATSQNKVYITIELENNASDFFGAEGLIPKGSKFYMVGELDPYASGITQPTGETLGHVFVKDHTTIANFTIKSLKKAYNHIPDMRSSKYNVGLAVDLSWKTGITFNVEL
ncbi:hypothetical protein [Prevotella sp.]|uniref:hypothetical protein n=1 Tax=Prevotella sp. TaxID=59823 RepID=UPI0025DEE92C|nr:hypothetical protein [Prevotella sp.]